MRFRAYCRLLRDHLEQITSYRLVLINAATGFLSASVPSLVDSLPTIVGAIGLVAVGVGRKELAAARAHLDTSVGCESKGCRSDIGAKDAGKERLTGSLGHDEPRFSDGVV